MATKIFKVKRAIYRVEQNENGTLDIFREYFTKNNIDQWLRDGHLFENAGSLIINAGGIAGVLRNCEEVDDLDGMVAKMNDERKILREKADIESIRRKEESERKAESDYRCLFDGVEVVETNAKTVYALLRYLNSKNWGFWKLPKMTIGYQCDQYDCDGRTATTIKLDEPICVGGTMGTMFEYGAPHGHLNKYTPIRYWE